ncbi:GTPase HflX [Bartonella sp. DGB1]|uniref:GTPase HflX n=1 Tax=Bartonella sp. DGB1 TaxID=3239807 RepID=UPI003524E359
MVLVPVPKDNQIASSSRIIRSSEALLEEALGLARAIDLNVVFSQVFSVSQIKSATLFGIGKIDEIEQKILELDVDLVIVDFSLTPIQQRNLEKAWKCKVIDRTGLILEIFGRRANTKESTLQVELAHLNYQKSRLVRSWTHLERQRGGAGFLGGPGETQIETDRRLIQKRIIKLKKELQQVVKHRELHRKYRKKSNYPIISLVGYTNAGKSTLFNLLSNSKVIAKDMLFATLSPALREIQLPHGTKAILSDTVGFISNLPPQLIIAFRATLEEVVEADIILHVRDISDPDNALQAKDVYSILEELKPKSLKNHNLIEVWNKSDLLSSSEEESCKNLSNSSNLEYPTFLISAETGNGIDKLLNYLENEISGELETYKITLDVNNGKIFAFIHTYASKIKEEISDKSKNNITVIFTMHKEKYELLSKMLNDKEKNKDNKNLYLNSG